MTCPPVQIALLMEFGEYVNPVLNGLRAEVCCSRVKAKMPVL
jgi:hypothetical protein